MRKTVRPRNKCDHALSWLMAKTRSAMEPNGEHPGTVGASRPL